MLKFIHGADFHLDSAFAALPPRQAAARRRESRELPQRLANYVNQNGIELVLLAGDLFDSASAYRDTAESLSRRAGANGSTGLHRPRQPRLVRPRQSVPDGAVAGQRAYFYPAASGGHGVAGEASGTPRRGLYRFRTVRRLSLRLCSTERQQSSHRPAPRGN